jgi:prepilin-type processing-associated H-X9-DG protein
MLGYLEQQVMYNASNFMIGNNEGYNFYANSTVTLARMTCFMCPSDPYVGTGALNLNNANNSYDNSYVGNQGTTTMTPQVNSATGSTGLFFYYVSYGIRDITDGATNTVAFSEALVGNPGQGSSGYRGTSIMSVSAVLKANAYDAYSLQAPTAATGMITTALQACQTAFKSAATNSTPLNKFRGIYWEVGANGMTWFNTIVTPNSTNYTWGDCRDQSGGWPDESTFATATSLHTGGVNCLMADGSCRFIKNTISTPTWWALGSRANGEVLSADSY